ncbi:MAG: OmpH family outer membrane protein [Candidatus Cloacimonetes bacterium]|nr:OmpH family outer membrane protein [Candidatus Cloacimonadota bacterium]
MKIAYVNTKRIYNENKKLREAQEALDAQLDIWRQEIQDLENNIEAIKTEYEEKKIILTQSSKDEALQKITDLESELRQKYKEIYGENGLVMQTNEDLVSPIMEELVAAIEKVAIEFNYTIVFDSNSGVLYAKPKIDITELVMSEMHLDIITDAPKVEQQDDSESEDEPEIEENSEEEEMNPNE